MGVFSRAACDDDCTGVLLDDLDALDRSITSLNLTGVVLAPYSQLSTLENRTGEVKVCVFFGHYGEPYNLSLNEQDIFCTNKIVIHRLCI